MRRFIVLMFLLVGAASAQPSPDWRPIQTASDIDPAMHGVWQSRGYGWVFDVGPEGVVGYDVSAAGCIEGETQAVEVLTSWVRLFAREGDLLRVAFREADATQYVLDRIDAVPASCATPPGASPREVFDYAWGVMDEHYAFFDLYGVDWDARYEELAPTVRDDMTDVELFDVLEAMLAGLADGHLELSGEVEGERRRFSGKGAAFFGPLLRAEFAEQDEHESLGDFSTWWFFENRRHIREEVLDSTASAAGGNVFWGRRGRIGYLSIAGMGGFAEDDDASLADELAAVHAVMDEAMTDLADTDALVLDIALNRGGTDEVSLAIASHFANRPTLGLTKQARGADERQPFTVRPAEGVRYLAPVSLLTSDVSVSAAETFAMEMRALPQVTHVGGVTRGALSDILFRPLPNGWMLELSNEIYLDAEGELWEGRGIAPDVPVTVFESGDLWGHVAAVRGIMDWMARMLGTAPSR